jgi:predicted XRE-type DNA-binding protein
MTEDAMRTKLRRYISQNYGTQAAYADELKVSRNLVSEVVLGKRRPPKYMLNDIGLKKVVTITYKPLQPGE